MSPQQTIAHYRITAKLGEGGMGEVWRAMDTKLDREVAIKILPEALAQDPDRMVRFEREAKVLASLNHPNIAIIHGVEERALVMELVEGPTLAERIGQGPLPLEEALPIAKQVAEALEYAHDHGIVHRDLKPANIKITPEGRVKVLDFGLAAIAQATAADAANSISSPTLTMRATQLGVILGTAAYMSPEQAKGKPVDRRADIWAFGVVLYEMLTARLMYSGDTVSETLASVIKDTPNLAALPESSPPAIRRMLGRCLEKEPRRRLQAIGEARIVLEEPAEETTPATTIAPPRGAVLPWMIVGALVVLLAGAASVALIHLREAPAPSPMIRFTVPPPDKGSFGQWISLSPDGRYLGFMGAGADGVARLWIRSLDSLESRPVASPESQFFYWSPDSRFVAFQSGDKLKKIDISGGGPPQTLCDVDGVLLGVSWNREGVIQFGTTSGPIKRVSDAGGTAVPVTKVEPTRGEVCHLDPTFLPDGRHFIYYRRSTVAENAGVYLGSLDVNPALQSLKRIQETDYSPGYAPPRPPAPGYLLFLREGTLMARAFDEHRLETVGEAVPIAAQVGSYLTRGFFSVSSNGILAYRAGGSATQQLTWYEREGHMSGRVGEPADLQDVALSPDATRAAYSLSARAGRQIWILDLVRGVNNQLTFTPGGALSPSWSPDGRRVAFGPYRSAQGSLYLQDAGNSGTEKPVFQSVSQKFLNDWSRDGRYLLYTEFGSGRGADLMALADPSGGGEGKPIAVANTKSSEIQGQFSPDTRWVAYASDESGRFEIYVRPFPPGDGTGKWLVSSAGGVQPRWRGDGKELYYLTPDPGRKVMAADIRTEPTFQRGTPHALFDSLAVGSTIPVFRYDVTRDGKRFLMVAPAAEQASVPVTVVLNWQEALKKK